MSDNPYAAIEVDDRSDLPDIYVDDRFLVVRSGSTLPRRCVVTNESLPDATPTEVRLPWRGRSFQIVSETRFCQLTLCQSQLRHSDNAEQTFARLGWFLILPVLLLTAIGVVNGSPLIVFGLIYLVLIGACGVFLQRDSSHLKVSDYKNGFFWIQGVNQQFLDQLRAELQGGQEPGKPAT